MSTPYKYRWTWWTFPKDENEQESPVCIHTKWHQYEVDAILDACKYIGMYPVGPCFLVLKIDKRLKDRSKTPADSEGENQAGGTREYKIRYGTMPSSWAGLLPMVSIPMVCANSDNFRCTSAIVGLPIGISPILKRVPPSLC